VAGQVRAEMARHRVTQAQLAPLVGLHPMSLSRRLSGDVPFDVLELYTIAEHLGVRVADLLPEEAA
jgi:transcriptional regulator with XRE-family HTH domain